MSGSRITWVAALGILLVASTPRAVAEPYLAVQQGYKCGACHVNPTGGGLRSDFGTIFTENVLPAHTLPPNFPVWSGKLFERMRIGADLRASESRTDVSGQPSYRIGRIDQIRAYANLSLVKDRLEYYLDEGLAPGDARPIEYYAKLVDPARGWYVKAGQFYLPFGWRLQDSTAFVRQVSGISMTTPDRGFEVGIELPELSAQLDYTRGVANVQTGTGHQLTGQLVWVKSVWRVGAAGSFTQSDLGNRRVFALFAGRRTGPVAWLGEIDLVRDAGFPEGVRQLVSALGEADWAMRKGHNLKLTGEYFDPDRHVAHDQKARWSLLYEYTPLPFIQLRAGLRNYDGIPQSDLDNRRNMFLELHIFM